MSRIDSILAFTVTTDEKQIAIRDECAKSPKLPKSVVGVGRLRLGMSLAQLKSILGNATRTHGNKLIYEFQTTEKLSGEEKKALKLQWPDEVWTTKNVISDIEIELSRNEVVCIRVSKTETE